MRLGDKIDFLSIISAMNEDLDPTETTEWVPLGKCVIVPNGAAAKTRGNDGNEYNYSYEVYMRKPEVLPKENDVVRVRKEDGSIDKECRVAGYVTLRNWLRLWLLEK